MRIGVLTGGGDCPGLNAVIRAVVRKGVATYGHEFVGFRDGWRGPLDGDTMPLGVDAGARHPAARRHDPRLLADQPVQGRRRASTRIRRATWHGLGVDALIAIGGEDTLGVATRLYERRASHVVGVPKTIDNDLDATDYTFGFDTAVNIAMEAIDRLHTTAESHHRVLIVEVMGRHAGWIALHAGLAGGANVILIPEEPFDIDAGLRLGASAGSRRTTRRSSWSPRARRPTEGDDGAVGTASWTPSGTSGSAGSASWLAERDREADRQGGPDDRARPHPARRHADRVRPGAGDPVRAARDRRGPRRRRSGRWSRCAAPTIVRVPLAEATERAEDRPARALRRGRGVLRLSPAGWAGRRRG